MIVGLGHVARVGKDVAAQALCRDLGFRRIGFADKLKELALEADPMIVANQLTNVGIGSGNLKRLVHSLGWDQVKDQFPQARKFLQELGVGGRNVFGENFWVEQALRGVGPADLVVVSDVRFVNEAEAIKAAGGRVVRINRPGRVAAGHISETALLDYQFDAEVDNSGSVIELEGKIVELVRGWLKAEDRAAMSIKADDDATRPWPVETFSVRGEPILDVMKLDPQAFITPPSAEAPSESRMER